MVKENEKNLKKNLGMFNHSCIQSKSDIVQTVWRQKVCPKNKKNYVLFNEVGNKFNKKKGLWYFRYFYLNIARTVINIPEI